jgi:putative ABC transport system permease protein
MVSNRSHQWSEFVSTFLQDFRFSLRQLVRNPGFALTAILSLALGIGATVSVFSAIYGVLLHPFPYPDIDRLANFNVRSPRGEILDVGLTGEQLRQLRNLSGFESIATWNERDLAITGHDVPEEVVAFFGIGSTFPTLGVPPLLGRNLGPSDSPDGQEPQPVVMLHYRFWKRYFNRDPAVIGKTLELDHKAYTIIGVSRPNFTWDWGADVYLPEEISAAAGSGIVFKLGPGVTFAAADAELDSFLRQFAKEHPKSILGRVKADIRPLTWEVGRNLGSTLYLLFAAVVILLAIGCSNVSILLLARGTARQHEFAVRSAVGASGVRIVRQLLTESLLLALTGTALGMLLAYRLLAVIVAWLSPHLFPPDVAIQINLPVLVFSAALALLTPVLFGLVPTLQMARPQISQVMQSSMKKTSGTVRGKRLHGALVGCQIALTLLLLTSAGTAIQAFIHLLRIPLGYDPHNVVAVDITLRDNTFMTWQARADYFEQLRTSVAALPDVSSVGISTIATPPNYGWERPFELLGETSTSPEADRTRIGFVDSGYFSALHDPLLQGRLWTPTEVARAAPSVLVNQIFAKRYSPNENIVGRSIKFPHLNGSPPYILAAPSADSWMQVIGVVGDARNGGIDKPVGPATFVPYSILTANITHILVRTNVAPELILHSIRKQIAGVNPDQQASRIETLEKSIQDEPVWARGRLISALFAGFSILALILSAVGLYSVVSYSVAQRTSEVGIRMALGAGRSHVLKVVMASAGLSVGIGIITGLALSLGLNRIISGWVGNSTSHPLIVLSVSLVLLIVAAVACLVPARRALSVDPMTALRCE